jgi:hypothetical protein
MNPLNGGLKLGDLVSHKRMSTFGKVIGAGITTRGVAVYMCEVPDAWPIHIWCGTIDDINVLSHERASQS